MNHSVPIVSTFDQSLSEIEDVVSKKPKFIIILTMYKNLNVGFDGQMVREQFSG